MNTPTKRAAGDGAAPPPPARRLRVTVAAPPGSSNPEPPSSPRRFLSIVLVILFFKQRGAYGLRKGRSTDSVPVSLSRIGRIELELERLRHSLGQVCGTLCTVLREQEHIKKLIRSLSSKLDNITGSSANHQQQLATQDKNNQKGTNAEGSVATEREGKESSIRLRFLSQLKSPVFHDDEIKSIRIGIFDGDKMIKSGPFSKLKVEVLALEGSFPHDAHDSWTSEEFHKCRAYRRDGEGNVLAGKGTKAQLIDGECHLGSIKFREGSCRARSGMFVIGARVCDGQAICVRVQEAVMNPPLVVQDRRNKYNEKSHPPQLNDEVSRLEKIGPNGKYRERLNEKKIFTVEDFLKALYKDEDNLASILQINKKSKNWHEMVKHAQECCLKGKPRLKSYLCEKENVVLFFDYVHRLVGAKFGGHYIASDTFEADQQDLVDTLKKNVYDQWDGLPENHVMKDNIPVPICMNANAGAGPSCVPSATQQKNSDHHITGHHPVGGTPAIEVLSPHDPTELMANDNNARSAPSSSIPDPYRTHNYQELQGLSYGLNESSCTIANNGPDPSISVPHQLGIQDQETLSAAQEHSDFHNDLYLDNLGAQAFAFAATDVIDMCVLYPHEAETTIFLQHQANNNDYLEIQSVPWPGNDTLEASPSADFNMAPSQGLTSTVAPGSAQGSVQGQTRAPLPNNGTAGSSEFARQALPQQQWS